MDYLGYNFESPQRKTCTKKLEKFFAILNKDLVSQIPEIIEEGTKITSHIKPTQNSSFLTRI